MPRPSRSLHRHDAIPKCAPTREDRKRKGEIVELCFAHRAARLGLIVSKPYGDSAPFDFVVEGGGILRVQVRSATFRGRSSYRIGTTRRDRNCFTPDQIDVLAAYVVPEDTWYLFPVDALKGLESVYLCGPCRAHECFRERWTILGAPQRKV